jgi:hypothetical protein
MLLGIKEWIKLLRQKTVFKMFTLLSIIFMKAYLHFINWYKILDNVLDFKKSIYNCYPSSGPLFHSKFYFAKCDEMLFHKCSFAGSKVPDSLSFKITVSKYSPKHQHRHVQWGLPLDKIWSMWPSHNKVSILTGFKGFVLLDYNCLEVLSIKSP